MATHCGILRKWHFFCFFCDCQKEKETICISVFPLLFIYAGYPFFLFCHCWTTSQIRSNLVNNRDSWRETQLQAMCCEALKCCLCGWRQNCTNNNNHLLDTKVDSVCTPTSTSLSSFFSDTICLSWSVLLPLYLISLPRSVCFSAWLHLPLLLLLVFIPHLLLSWFEASERSGWGGV